MFFVVYYTNPNDVLRVPAHR